MYPNMVCSPGVNLDVSLYLRAFPSGLASAGSSTDSVRGPRHQAVHSLGDTDNSGRARLGSLKGERGRAYKSKNAASQVYGPWMFWKGRYLCEEQHAVRVSRVCKRADCPGCPGKQYKRRGKLWKTYKKNGSAGAIR